jgi:cyclase
VDADRLKVAKKTKTSAMRSEGGHMLRATLLLVLLPTAALGQTLPRDASARVEGVADGVYVILHDDATDEWPHGNTGVIVGSDAVAVIDSTYLPSRAKADIALIRALTDKPVRYLVNTHWHFDHNNGASAYRDAFPAIAVVSERETAGFIALNQAYWSKMSTAEGSTRRAALKDLPVDVRARRQRELDELAGLRIVTPDLVFDGALTLPLGNRRVDLRDLGRANSPHDVIAWLPDARVLFTGDIVVQSPLPYPFGSFPVPWIDVLRQLEAMPIAALVPGHGPVMRDHTYTKQVRALLEAATSRVADLVRQGRTLEQVQNTVDLTDIRQSVEAWRSPALDRDWKDVLTALIERAWRGVRGQG